LEVLLNFHLLKLL